MVRTSRCLARLLSQFDGPDALVTVRRYLCDLHLADFSFARITRCPLAMFFSVGRANKMEHPYEVIGGGSPIHRFGNQRARELRVPSLARALIVQAIFESQPQAQGVRGEWVAHCAAGC
jgi:protoheme ferro-lyase